MLHIICPSWNCIGMRQALSLPHGIHTTGQGGCKEDSRAPLGPFASSNLFFSSSIFPTNPSMRFDRLLPALYSLFTAVSAQTLSGLTFDGRDEVSLIWAFDGQTTGSYDFYLCAGDESTGAYVSGTASTQTRSRTKQIYTGVSNACNHRRHLCAWRLCVFPS